MQKVKSDNTSSVSPGFEDLLGKSSAHKIIIQFFNLNQTKTNQTKRDKKKRNEEKYYEQLVSLC